METVQEPDRRLATATAHCPILIGPDGLAEKSSKTRTVRSRLSARITFHEPRKEPLGLDDEAIPRGWIGGADRSLVQPIGVSVLDGLRMVGPVHVPHAA